MRMDIEVMGMSNYQVANTTKGASFWPVQGMDAPQDMDPEQYKSVSNQLDLHGALCNYKEKGNAVELLGRGKNIDGAEAHKLKVTHQTELKAPIL